MGLLSSLLGNASEIDIPKVKQELAPLLVPGEVVGKGCKLFRDLFIFTDHRLILIDKQGLTGSNWPWLGRFSPWTAGAGNQRRYSRAKDIMPRPTPDNGTKRNLDSLMALQPQRVATVSTIIKS